MKVEKSKEKRTQFKSGAVFVSFFASQDAAEHSVLQNVPLY